MGLSSPIWRHRTRSGLVPFNTLFPGATALFSLRNLNNPNSSVVRVRRDRDDAESDFTASQVAGSTLLDYVVPPAVQALYNNAMYFDGVNDEVMLGSTVSLTGDFHISFKILPTNFSLNTNYRRMVSDGAVAGFLIDFDGGVLFRTSANQNLNGAEMVLNEINDVSITRTGSTVYATINGVNTSSVTNSDTFNFRYFGSSDADNFMAGSMWDISVVDNGTEIHRYTGDGNANANWLDQVGSNNGTVAGSPAIFTGQGYNGFVTKWYDQSIDRNDARMYFDGVNDRVTKSSGSLSGTFNVKGKAELGTTGRLAVWGRTAVSQYIITFDQPNGRFQMRNTAGTVYSSTGSTITYPSTGVMFDWELDVVENEASLYINDVLQDTVTVGGTFIGEEIGATPSTGDYFTGILSDFYVNDVLVARGHGITSADWGGGAVSGSPAEWYKVANGGNTYRAAQDATQTTAANQPLIVSNGALVTDNGKPALDFDGINDILISSTPAINSTDNDGTIVSVSNSDGTDCRIVAITNANASTWYTQNIDSNKLTTSLRVSGGTIYTETSTDNESANTNLSFSTFNEPNIAIGLNGATEDTQNVGAWATDSFVIHTIGGLRNNNTSFNTGLLTGKMQEVIIYDTDKSADRIGIEANINTHYGIY